MMGTLGSAESTAGSGLKISSSGCFKMISKHTSASTWAPPSSKADSDGAHLS